MNQFPKWMWWTIGGMVVVLILLSGSVYTVSEREVAVVLEFGKPVAARTTPGLYFKVPLTQNVERYPKTLQFWRSSAQETLVDLPTADKKKIEVAAWAIWRINDPIKFRQVLVSVANAESAVKDRVRAAIRDEITSHALSEVIRSTDRELTYSLQFALPGEEDEPQDNPALNQEEENLIRGDVPRSIKLGREEIMRRIRDNVQKRLKGAGESGTESDTDRGIELVDVGIHNVSFVPTVREAAFDRLKTAMEAIAAKHTNEGVKKKQVILNETQAEVERITGEGEGESSAIRGRIDAEIIADYAKAINETGDFYNFERTLKLYQESLQGKSNRLILTTDSELFRLLKELDKSQASPTMPATAEESAPMATTKAEED